MVEILGVFFDVGLLDLGVISRPKISLAGCMLLTVAVLIKSFIATGLVPTPPALLAVRNGATGLDSVAGSANCFLILSRNYRLDRAAYTHLLRDDLLEDETILPVTFSKFHARKGSELFHWASDITLVMQS